MNDMTDFWLGADDQEMMPRSGRSRFNRHINRRIAVRELGRNICFGKGSGGSAPTPDPAIGQAAMKNAEVGEQWLGFAREQFTEGNARLEVMDNLTQQVIQQQINTQDRANEWAQEDRDRYKKVFQPLQDEYVEQAREDRQRYKTVFQPLEDDFVNTAKNYDSAENQDRAAAEAAADVQKATDAQRDISSRSMASMGINPNSGRFAGVSRADSTNAALATAGASNTARRQVRDQALNLKSSAINLGSGLKNTMASAINVGAGLPASTIASSGLGLNAGNSAINNNATANNDFYKNTGVMGQGFGGAMQGYNNQGSILNNLYGSQVNAWAAQQQANATSAAGIGQLVGTGIGAYAAL